MRFYTLIYWIETEFLLEKRSKTKLIDKLIIKKLIIDNKLCIVSIILLNLFLILIKSLFSHQWKQPKNRVDIAKP